MRRDGLTLGWGVAACSWLGGAVRLLGVGRAARRWDGTRGVGIPGHRNRHLHCAGADGGRAAGDRERSGRGGAGRYQPAAGSAFGWLDAHGVVRGTDPTAIEEAGREADRRSGCQRHEPPAIWNSASGLVSSRAKVSASMTFAEALRRRRSSRSLVRGRGKAPFRRRGSRSSPATRSAPTSSR